MKEREEREMIETLLIFLCPDPLTPIDLICQLGREMSSTEDAKRLLPSETLLTFRPTSYEQIRVLEMLKVKLEKCFGREKRKRRMREVQEK